MNARRAEPYITRIGIAGGVLAVATFVLIAGRPSAAPTGGLELGLVSNRTGELAVSPARTPFLRGRALRAGRGRATGRLAIENETPATIEPRLRLTGRARDLDGAIELSVTAGETPIFRGPLRGLRRWTRAGAPLRVGGSRALAFRAWLDRSATPAYQGRAEDYRIELDSRPLTRAAQGGS